MDEVLSLGTLAGSTLVGTGMAGSVQERTWISSIRAAWSLNDFTPAVDAGPIMVGVAHNDYSDAEIEAWIENAGSWDEGDLVSQEVAKRKIRMVGVFDAAALAEGEAVLNDGKPITTKCGWILNQADTLKMWAYNMGAQALATTTPSLRAQGHANLWPK